MEQKEKDKKLIYIIFIIIALILIMSIMSILNYLSNQEIDKSHKIPIFNENEERMGTFEIYDIHFEGGHKIAPYLPLEMVILKLDNQSNYVQFSSHFTFNSTISNFSVEFIDDGDNRIGTGDRFIFYNYSDDIWIRIANWANGYYYGTKIYIK